MKKIKGGIYEGQLKDGKRHGYGSYTDANGNKYEGQFKDGKRHGYGIDEYTFVLNHKYKSKYKYVGDWKNDKKHGQGAYTNSTNGNYERELKESSKYIGEFKDGEENGYGVCTWSDGSKYIGEFKDGEKNGYGTYTLPNDYKYVGQWKDDEENGYGTETSDYGHYVGEFKEGIPSGNGIFEDEYKKIFGVFDRDKEHPSITTGNGVVFYKNGIIFKGTFYHYSPDSGIAYFKDGAKAEGEFDIGTTREDFDNEGACYGLYKGTYTSKDKEQRKVLDSCWAVGIEGIEEVSIEYLPDNRYGQGTCKYANGDKYEGQFKDGKRHGRGTFTHSDFPNQKYVGDWKNDKKHGQGVYDYASGNKYEGQFKDGERHGQAIYTNVRGVKYEEIWKDGRRVSGEKIIKK
jgi:hypothetical protein